MMVLAIDIGGTKYSLAVFDGDRIIERESRPTERSGGREWMLPRIMGLAKEWQDRFHFNLCGVGFWGPVDFAGQRIAMSTHVGGWSDTPLTEMMQEELKIPAIMDNDANVGALGEHVFGAGRSFDPMFYMPLSTGIGAGISNSNRILRGADSYAGEIGHITIRPDGPACLCGAQGCYERMCCGLWLERDYGKPASDLMQDESFMERYVVDLALGLKSCIMLLNPARIVIGGGISKAGDRLFVPLRSELRRQITQWSRARLDVVPAGFGDDSVLYGA